MRSLLLFLLLASSPCFGQGHTQVPPVPPSVQPPAFELPMKGHCYSYEVVEATLWKFGETSMGRSRVASGSAVEIFIGAKLGSLTVVEIQPSGLACYRSFGDGWGAQAKNMRPT